MPRQLGFSTMALGLGFAALVQGCAIDPGVSAPTSLREIEIAPDFTFATSAPVRLESDADPVFARQTQVEVRLPSGELVHAGPLSEPIELSVARHVRSLSVTLRSPGIEDQRLIPVEDGVARIAWE